MTATEDRFEFGPNFGVFLPSGMPEIDQVLKGFGLHAAFPIGESYILTQFEYGRGSGATMAGILIDFRTPAPDGDFSPYFCLGPHFYFSRGADAEENNYQPYNRFSVGFNIGGGFFANINENLKFDFMIRLNGNPGAVIYIGAGLNFYI
ncbi:MAG: hypothetical protein JXA66_06675 [Oligoflexia bacterium]|nr:hypothetical protein [Oligoflexia bacterium]